MNMIDPTGHSPWGLDILNFAKELVTNVAPQVAMADGPATGPADVGAAGVLVFAGVVAVIGGLCYVGDAAVNAIGDAVAADPAWNPNYQPAPQPAPAPAPMEDVIDGTIALNPPSSTLTQSSTEDNTKTTTIDDAITDTVDRPERYQPVYRVVSSPEFAYGQSWTPIDPRMVPNYRDVAGLPSGGESGYNNTGDYLVTGVLINPMGIELIRPALPLDGNKGGLIEYVIRQPVSAYIAVLNIQKVDKPF